MHSSDQLFAGAAKADITPDFGMQLDGDIGRLRPVEEIHDRLYARALVLQVGETRYCLLSLDLLSSNTAPAFALRQQIGARLGISPEAVMLHVTQNHAAPSLGHLFLIDEEHTHFPPEYPWLYGGDAAYNPICIAGCLRAVEEAAAHMQPVRAAAGRGIDGRLAYNRRFVLRDGTARTHPELCDPNILYCEGPADPEVGVLTLTALDGQPVAALLHFTCHPIYGYPNRYVIGDWPGAWSALMEAQHGGVALVVNGCCGNISPSNHLHPEHVWPQDGYQGMAMRLMETTGTALGRLAPLDAPALGWRQTHLRLPLRRPTPEVVAEARALLEQYPTPKFTDAAQTQVDWDWVYALGRLDLHDRVERDPFFDYEIQAFRLGDAAIVTLMGEPFVEVQLRIKLASPLPYTFVAHFCNGYAGYIPTEEAFRRGGYETRTSNGSKFQPDALEKIGDAAISLLGAVAG